MRDLLQRVGTITTLWAPDSYDSDVDAAAGDARIKVEGYKGVLFVIMLGDIVHTGVCTFSVVYGTSNSTHASDYAELAGATDAVLSVDSDTTQNTTYLIDVFLGDKTVVAAGYLAMLAAPATAATEFAVLAIPYGGNITLPVSQSHTATET